MANEEITVFAETNYRNNFRKFGIKTDDRRRHMYLIGKTGMGKSTVLENIIINDIRAGYGVAVVDPHGDLAEKIIEFIPSSRVNDVIYFNPADIEYPIAFNVVEQVEPHLRHLVASGLIGVFQKLWADSWGPRLEYILRNAILAILDYPGSTLLGITRMLSDKAFRKKVIDKIQDPVVKSFWLNEFANYAKNFASEAVSPIQNKVGQFLSSSLIRNIVGQVKSSIDLREVMDQGKILILNLSKGRIGEDNSALLGAMMITKIQLAVMSRVDIPEKERRDFYLYIDEFQNFTTDSFANILSEARKYRLNLIMAHQYIEQLGEKVAAAVFGNIGTMIVFRVGAADAEELVKEYTPVFTEEDLVNLPKFEFYIKLMIDGIASDPFSARGLPPLAEEERTDTKDKVIRVSRERYAKNRDVVEEKISRWYAIDEEVEKKPARKDNIRISEKTRPTKILEPRKDREIGVSHGSIANRVNPVRESRFFTPSKNDFLTGSASSGNDRRLKAVAFSNGVKIQPEARPVSSSNGIYKFEAICSRCGKPTNISFAPDGIRPIFCKECLSRARAEKRQEIEARIAAKKEELAKLEQSNGVGLKQPANIEPEVTLKQALQNGAVDFSGQRIANKSAPAEPERQPADLPSKATEQIKAKNAKADERELKEDEEISF